MRGGVARMWCAQARSFTCFAAQRAAAAFSVPSTASESSRDADVLGQFFYRNKQVERWGNKPAVRMTLRQLILFGQSARRNRQLLMESANYVRTELATRVAHRLRDMQNLPFVVMSSECMDRIYQHYWRVFETLRQIDRIETMDQNEQLVQVLAETLADHESKLSLLSSVPAEAGKYMDLDALDLFLARMLRSQISREVLAKQHMSLWAMQSNDAMAFPSGAGPATVGMIDTDLDVARAIESSIESATKAVSSEHEWPVNDTRIPKVTVDGSVGARIAYLPVHLDFALLVLLKVAMQNTIRFHGLATQPEGTVANPVLVTIVEGPVKEDLILRVSDQGGGLESSEPRRIRSAEGGQQPAAHARGPLLIPGSDSPTVHAGTQASAVWSFANIATQLSSIPAKADEQGTDTQTKDPLSTLHLNDSLMRLALLKRDARSALPMYVVRKAHADEQREAVCGHIRWQHRFPHGRCVRHGCVSAPTNGTYARGALTHTCSSARPKVCCTTCAHH